MAGIKVSQYEVFKIDTGMLKYADWKLDITVKEAREKNLYVALFESQLFRIIAEILGEPIGQIKFRDYVLMVVINNKSHFEHATKPDGVVVNGKQFRRFVGTTNGLKMNTLVFVNTEIFDELYRRCECGRDPGHKLVPAKYEAYKSLTCSASQPICDPKGILVVSDALVKIHEDIIEIDDSGDSEEPLVEFKRNVELENNATDGFNLCTIGYMERVAESLMIDYTPAGVCLRNAWLKGMLYPFPIVEFAEKVNGGNYIVKDIWGYDKDLREVEMILTESSLKLWDCYTSIEDYLEKTKANGYGFAVTKIAPEVLEDEREVNYQYLQSYDLTDNEIEELCKPTVDYIKGAMGGDYKTMLDFIGANENSDSHSWQRALYESEYMANDPYVLDCISRLIRKRIDRAKIGKLMVKGNYQICSGDPYILMQHICGLEETGLLKANQIYSNYWRERQVNEVVVFRSPMTSHNNIRRCKVGVNDEIMYWYQYMRTIIILNSFDTICQSLNGCDHDGDILYSTNNKVLLQKHRVLPAIICIQKNVAKEVISEEGILKSNWGGMGNDVGSITNRVTAMMEVQAHFTKGSKEYNVLQYRIEAGQHYQQLSIDRIKGILAAPMPDEWYKFSACKGDEFKKSICCEKRPYFMIYVYDDYKRENRVYFENVDDVCQSKFNFSYENLKKLQKKTNKMRDFIRKVEKFEPFGKGKCTMNRICWYIEDCFNGLSTKMKKGSNFDYRRLMTDSYYRPDKYYDISDLIDQHKRMLQAIKDDEDKGAKAKFLMKANREEALNICPDENELADIMVALTYGQNKNQDLCWGYVGKVLCNRLREMEHDCNR